MATTVISVWLPLMFSGYFILKHWKRLGTPHVALLFGTVLTGYVCSWWRDVPNESISLHIVPTAFITIAVLNYYYRKSWPPGLAYAGTFFSLLSVDFLRAVERFVVIEKQGWSALVGVGGAGVGDGLFVIPLSSAILQVYVSWRFRFKTNNSIRYNVNQTLTD